MNISFVLEYLEKSKCASADAATIIIPMQKQLATGYPLTSENAIWFDGNFLLKKVLFLIFISSTRTITRDCTSTSSARISSSLLQINSLILVINFEKQHSVFGKNTTDSILLYYKHSK